MDGVHAILAECGRDLSDRLGLHHWNPPYPLDAMRADAATREVYAVEQDGVEIATYTVGTTPLPSYPPTLWTPDTDPALYLNRLAVRPNRQGRGIGCWCLAESNPAPAPSPAAPSASTRSRPYARSTSRSATETSARSKSAPYLLRSSPWGQFQLLEFF